MTKAIISLSGGMDSTTLLAEAISQERQIVAAVAFRYGSKHNFWENQAARLVAQHYGIPFRLIELDGVMAGFQSNLLKSGGPIPEGHYEEASMAQTVVPGRNMIFASILTGLAWSLDASEVWLGIHAGDRAIYPDCRPAFFQAMGDAMYHGSDYRVELRAPFLDMNKTSIIALGMKLDVPYQLTRTCYKDQELSCGKCGACCERLESFRNNGIADPISYEENCQ